MAAPRLIRMAWVHGGTLLVDRRKILLLKLSAAGATSDTSVARRREGSVPFSPQTLDADTGTYSAAGGLQVRGKTFAVAAFKHRPHQHGPYAGVLPARPGPE